MSRLLRVTAVLAVVLLTASFSMSSSTGGGGMVHIPEPYDFHYPDEGYYPDVANSLELQSALGDSTSATFVYVPATPGEIEVVLADLVAPDGTVFPKENLDVGVVVFMDRTREAHYFRNVSPRGEINGDVAERAPVMPMAIVPDESDFLTNTGTATGAIQLRTPTNARAIARPGRGTQFWLTARVPADLAGPELLTTYRGSATVVSGGVSSYVPISLTVLSRELDALADHDKYVGVFQGLDQFDAEFRDTVMGDLREHGVNAMFYRGATIADYQYFRRNEVSLVLNADDLYGSADEIAAIRDTGFQPLFYGYDEPNQNGTINEHVEASDAIHSRGGLIGTSGSLTALQEADRRSPQNWWNLSFATSWSAGAEVFAHLDAVRADSRNRLADLESVYPMTLLELYPLNTRLLYGLWLYRSNLDGGFAWAYSSDTRLVNPYTKTDWNGVAFPAEFYDEAGSLTGRDMLSSYVWEAFRDGVTDMRYALTVERLLAERGSDAEKQEFEDMLARYDQIFAGPEATRIDIRNSNATVRETRTRLFAMLTDLSSRIG